VWLLLGSGSVGCPSATDNGRTPRQLPIIHSVAIE
jgi:hypothetical protein